MSIMGSRTHLNGAQRNPLSARPLAEVVSHLAAGPLVHPAEGGDAEDVAQAQRGWRKAKQADGGKEAVADTAQSLRHVERACHGHAHDVVKGGDAAKPGGCLVQVVQSQLAYTKRTHCLGRCRTNQHKRRVHETRPDLHPARNEGSSVHNERYDFIPARKKALCSNVTGIPKVMPRSQKFRK